METAVNLGSSWTQLGPKCKFKSQWIAEHNVHTSKGPPEVQLLTLARVRFSFVLPTSINEEATSISTFAEGFAYGWVVFSQQSVRATNIPTPTSILKAAMASAMVCEPSKTGAFWHAAPEGAISPRVR